MSKPPRSSSRSKSARPNGNTAFGKPPARPPGKPGGKPTSRHGNKPGGRKTAKPYATGPKPERVAERPAPRRKPLDGGALKPNGSVVMGRNSVATLLEASPARVRALVVEDTPGSARRLNKVMDQCREHRIRVYKLPRIAFEQRLQRWWGDGDDEGGAHIDLAQLSHQGVFAEVSPKAQPSIYELAKRYKAAIEQGEKPLVIALDKVTDARNFGAILRVADGVGAMAVLTTSRHSAQWSPAVGKTASGAEATVDVVTVPNLVNGLTELKKAGGWAIGTSDAAEGDYTQFAFNAPTVLVMGSEDKGLGQVVTKACDGLVSIPMRGAVSSLNVAVATAVVAYAAQHQLSQCSPTRAGEGGH